jgi:hypothetical protein
MSVPPGRPKEGSLPLGGKARSAKGAHICVPPGRPKEGSLLLGGKARSAKGAQKDPHAIRSHCRITPSLSSRRRRWCASRQQPAFDSSAPGY